MTPFQKIELFDWTSEDEQTQIRFHVTLMLQDIKNSLLPFEWVTTPMDPDFARDWVMKRA